MSIFVVEDPKNIILPSTTTACNAGYFLCLKLWHHPTLFRFRITVLAQEVKAANSGKYGIRMIP
jgi:hypothetical protein